MRTYTIDSDLNDEKAWYLGALQVITGLIALCVLGLTVTVLPSSPVPWVALFGILLVCDYLKRRQRITLASWAYIAGLLTISTLLLWEQGPVGYIYFLFLIPVALSGLLLESSIDSVTALSILAMLGGTLHHEPLLPALGHIIIPSAMSIGLAIISYVAVHNNMGLLNWAIDSEQKNAHRAEMFYQQGEQLKQALLDVQHARSRLERMNVDLAEAQHRAERASAAKSVFLSNMSHELRTPLNVIIGYTSSMLNMPQMYSFAELPPVYRNDIQLIKENGEYLVGLINDILDLSKIEAGKLELHPEAVSLPDLLRGTIATSIGLLKDKPLQIVPDFPDQMPLVWADPMRVRQIILNLMSNAIKFTETGTITLSAKQDGERIRISVTDTGIGIPAEALPVIFDRFKQAEQDTDKRYGGTGLGLDISQQLSKMHGSELTVQSEVGRGSTFSFTLPLATDQAAASKPGESPTSVRIFDNADYDDLQTVLLVEDDAATRTMLRRVLENAGYLVVDTGSGNNVMDMASGLLPSVIILDINLPERNGWSILTDLKADPETASIPVIVCTVDPDEDRSAVLGAALHLRKPFEASDLLARIQQVLSPIAERVSS
jgi:signal transduction histidine kinase/ActR/RegA family two-component response regulator